MVNTNSGNLTPDFDMSFHSDEEPKKTDSKAASGNTLSGKTVSNKSDGAEFKFKPAPLGSSEPNDLKERKVSPPSNKMKLGIEEMMADMGENEAGELKRLMGEWLLEVEQQLSSPTSQDDLGASSAPDRPEAIQEVFTKTVSPTDTEKRIAPIPAPDKNALTRLFGLDLPPTTPEDFLKMHKTVFTPFTLSKLYENANKEKINLMQQHLPQNVVSTLTSQTRMFPIMNAALNKIVDNLDKWNDLLFSNENLPLEELKVTIGQQLQNLAVLSEIVSSETPTYEETLALATMSPASALKGETPITEHSFERILDLYLTGDKNLNQPEPKKFLGTVIKNYISQLKAEIPLEQPKNFKKKPTTDAIGFQAELIQTMRKGSAWAAAQPAPLVRQTKDSVNTVFQLHNPDPLKTDTVAYYKVGKGDEQAAGIMEKLMWDVGVLMGMENQFVPTGITQVRAGPELVGGTEKAVTWKSEGERLERLEVNTAKPALRGGIQVAQKGMTLAGYLKDVKDPSSTTVRIGKQEVIDATLTSLVFGMFDAHNENIFVTENGKIKYFDNTRSLAHGNNFIHRGNGAVSSYRCGLLALPEARKKLTQDEIDDLKIAVAGYKEKMENLKDFFKNPMTQKQVNQLPEGWLWPDESIDAMSERLNNLEEALNSGKPLTLEQLAIETVPSYKFAFAVTLMRLIGENHIKTEHSGSTPITHVNTVRKLTHVTVGYEKIDNELKKMPTYRFDVDKVKTFCSNDVSINQIWQFVKELNNNPSPTSYAQILADEGRIEKEIMMNCIYDYKDIPKNHCKSYIRDYNLETFDNQGIEHYNASSIAEGVLSADNTSTSKMLLKCDDQYHIIFQTPTGYRNLKSVDLSSKHEELIYNGDKISIQDLISLLENEDFIQSPPKWEQLPSLSVDELSAMMSSKSPGEIIFAKDEALGSLILALYVNGEVTQLSFPHSTTTPESYIDNGEELTAGELMQKYTTTIDTNTIDDESGEISGNIVLLNEEEFEDRGVELIGANKISQGILFAAEQKMDNCVLKCGEDFYLIIKSSTGFRVKDMDLSSAKGQIRMDSVMFSIEELVDLLKTHSDSLPPNFDILPVLTFEELQQLMTNFKPGNIILSKDVDNRSLVIGYNDKGTLNQSVFEPGEEEGTFIDGDEELTIEEFIEKYQNLSPD